jgi:acyl transferase domain-containing protein/phosphopantetheinyl transferase
MIHAPLQHDRFAGEDIAIVGMSCLFPGADSPARFWQNIVGKVDCITDAPANWQPELFYDPHDPNTDRAYTKRGGFLGDLCRFDPKKYGVMPSSIEGAEPDHFIALRCAFEALSDAGVPDVPINRQKTGVILGRGLFANRGWISVFQQLYAVDQVIGVVRRLNPELSEEHLAQIKAELKRNLPPANSETFPGLVHSALVGRIANRLDLNGPAYTVDAACSAALLAVDQAVHELRSGRCDAVLVGGTQVSTPPQIQILFCKIQALSRSGKIAPFSAEANGTMLGQGCGMLLLKRKSDAQRDGNRIYALLKEIGSSSDGKGAGLLAPRTEGQQLAIRRAYEQSGIDPSTIELIEAHGTGIPMGDATEMESIRACFPRTDDSPPRVAFGSVKSMIGHLIPAAGIASLIKTTLALYHRVLPPTLHVERPAPGLALDDTHLMPCREPLPWLHAARHSPRRAGINAFGFGGINTHAIVEEHVPADESQQTSLEREWPFELVVVSADDRASLRDRLVALSEWIQQSDGVSLLDVAASAARRAGAMRLAIVASSLADLRKKLAHAAKLLTEPQRNRIQDRKGIFWYERGLAREGRIAFVFPGEGAQYVHMHAELCRHFPEVRRQLELTDLALRQREERQSLAELIYPAAEQIQNAEAALYRMEYALAAVTASSRGLLELLKRLGIQPSAVVGHSSGEFAAVLASGAFSPTDEAELFRSIINGTDCAAAVAKSNAVAPAVLISVGGVEPGAVREAIERSSGRLTIAMDNCPHQVILVGDERAAEEALAHLQGRGGICQRLPWDRPYHTAAVEPICGFLERYVATLSITSPHVELWSCATASVFPDDPQQIRELMVRQWRMPVRFRETIRAMFDAGARIFIEAGPRGNLSAFIADTLGDLPHAAIPLDVQRKGDLEQLCHAVGMLAAHGADVELDALYRRRTPRIVDLDGPPIKAPPPDPILKLELPTLELGDDLIECIERSRSAPRSRNETIHAGTAHTNGQPQPTPIAAPSARRGQNVATSASTSRGSAATPALPRLAAGPASSPPALAARSRAIVDFQKTMQQFLETQRQCMAATLSGVASKAAPRPPATPARTEFSPPAAKIMAPNFASVDQPLPNGAATESASAPPRLRYIQTVLEHRPGEKLVAECELDVHRDTFLKDHTFFGRGLSDHDPQLLALPIMPLAMTSELMAQAALALHPERRVTAISDIRASRWLAFETDVRRVRMAAQTLDHAQVRVVVYEADREGASAEIAAGTVELADAPLELGPPVLHDRSEAEPPFEADAPYGRLLYHGPIFQGIERIERWGMRGIRATVREPDMGRMFRDPAAGLPVLPVTLTDTVSQIPGLRNGNFDEEGSIVQLAFPNHIERLEFDERRPAGESLVAVTTFDQREGKLLSDAEVATPSGRVVLRYLGKTEEIVDFPLRLYRYASTPRQVRCSRDVTSLFDDLAGMESCTVCESHVGQEKLFVNRLWSQVLARMILSRREHELFASLKLPPAAAVEWLLGRVAAKDAVRLHARLDCGMADVSIANDKSGRPHVADGAHEPPRISIAHKPFYAVAAAADPARFEGVGIDLEVLNPMDPALVADAFDGGERRLLAEIAAAAGVTPQQAGRIAWAAKEAVGKALGSGVIGGPGSIRLTEARETTLVAILSDKMARQFPQRASAVEVAWRIHADWVVTLCLLEADRA